MYAWRPYLCSISLSWFIGSVALIFPWLLPWWSLRNSRHGTQPQDIPNMDIGPEHQDLPQPALFYRTFLAFDIRGNSISCDNFGRSVCIHVQSERGMGLSSLGVLSDLAGFFISAVGKKGVTAGREAPEQMIEHVYQHTHRHTHTQIYIYICIHTYTICI